MDMKSNTVFLLQLHSPNSIPILNVPKSHLFQPLNWFDASKKRMLDTENTFQSNELLNPVITLQLQYCLCVTKVLVLSAC